MSDDDKPIPYHVHEFVYEPPSSDFDAPCRCSCGAESWTSSDKQPPAIGERVAWSTLGGARYEGIVVEIDNEDMVVLCDDGRERVTPWE